MSGGLLTIFSSKLEACLRGTNSRIHGICVDYSTTFNGV